MTDKLLLTAEEAAERLGVSRTNVYRLIAGGKLRSVKIGKLRRVSTAALADFVEKLEAEQKAAPS